MKYIFILFITCSYGFLFAQNNVGIGTNTPHVSSKLDISDTSKGILIPRMNSTQRNAIVSPANGLLVYDNDSLAFMYFNGSVWKKMATSFTFTENDPQVSSSSTNLIPRWNGSTLTDGIIQDDATNIGIGTAPVSGQKITINGKTTTTNLQMTTGGGAGKILQSDASGNASWVNPPSNTDTDSQSLSLSGNNLTISRGNTIDISSLNANTWKTTGNSGTNAATNFIGTTDNIDLVFKNNNNQNMRLFVNGSWLVGDSIQGIGYKTFFDNTKGAFRTGRLTLSGSRFWDRDSIGVYSFATGADTRAKGTYSSAFGTGTYSNGFASVATGILTESNGLTSFSMGYNTKARGDYSLSAGLNSIANGYNSIALGSNTLANVDYSTTLGYYTIANGLISTAMGNQTQANGLTSIAMGNNTIANGSISTAFGAVTLANGIASTAMGNLTQANGSNSTSLGFSTKANGTNSTAMGNSTEANGSSSTALGFGTKANGNNTTSMGLNTIASGVSSTAMGSNTISNGFSSLVIGLNNDTLTPIQVAATSTTPLFIVGNGTSTSSRSNAMMVRNDGNVAIGNITPTSKLDVDGKTKTINFQMTNGAGANKILQSDASGNASWVNPTSIATTDSQSLSLSGNNLSISRGNTIDLSSIFPTEFDPEVSSFAINRIPRWNGVTLIDGVIRDDAINIGIGTDPIFGQKLTVDGKTTTTDLQITNGSGVDKILKSDASGNASWFMGAIQDDATNVGIGIAPVFGQKLTVNGQTTTTNLQITSGAGANKILQSDASGNASWVNFSSIETDPEVTAVAINSIPRWNGTTLMDGVIQDDASNVGIGTAPVSGQKLTVNGQTTTTNLQMTNGAGTNRILKSDASGNASWFLGAIEDDATNVGIGTPPIPGQKLTVNGQTTTTNLQMTNGAGANKILLSDAIGNASWVNFSTIESDPEVTSFATNRVPRWNGTTLMDGVIQDDASNIGIGTAPVSGQKLTIAGKTTSIDFQMTNGAGANKILQSDASGNASWVNPTSIAGSDSQSLSLSGNNLSISRGNTLDISPITSNTWKTTGNAGTNAATNFIGTTDNVDLVFKNNNNQNMRLFADGSWLVGDSIQGAGTKTFFDFSKRAFRSGSVSFTSTRFWDKDSLGLNSFAAGFNTIAKGEGATALGTNTFAYGINSTALGNNTSAQGVASIAIGVSSEANGFVSTAIGYNTEALGDASTAIGYGTRAIGIHSTAMGENTTANGLVSTSMGYFTTANGQYSTTLGNNTTASGMNSTAMGFTTEALGNNSTAMGNNTNALGTNTTAMGISSTAIGDASVAMGINTFANGNSSIAMGSSSAANGNVSMAMGTNTRANGVNTSALGSFTVANGYSSLVIGQFNDSLVFPQTSSNTATPLFIIGNGTSISNRTNAMVVRQDGNVAIGNITPTSKLDVDGKTKTINFQMTNGAGAGKILQSDASGNASWVNPSSTFDTDSQSISLSGNNLSISRGNTIDLSSLNANTWKTNGNSGINAATNFIGTTNFADLVFKTNNNQNMRLFANGSWLVGDSIQGTGTKIFFDNTKAAFRTGNLSFIPGSRYWDIDSIGMYSFASGRDTRSKGNFSNASGLGTVANGLISTAMGDNTIANGTSSISMGSYTEANGRGSISMGSNTIANGFSSLVIGLFNDTIVSSQTLITSNTPLFIIGNGTNDFNRKNAVVVQQDGDFGINNNDPLKKLHILGDGGKSNATSSTDAEFVLEEAGDELYMSILTDTNRESGYQFGNQFSGAHAGIYYNSGGNTFDMRFRANGNNTRMTIDKDGQVGIGTTTPNSDLETTGSLAAAILTTSASITLNENHHTVILTSGTPTVTLPAASTCERRIYVIVNQTGGSRSISSYISFTGVVSTSVFSASSITIQSDGTNWYRIQ